MTIYTSNKSENLSDILFSSIKSDLGRIRSKNTAAKRVVLVVPAQESLSMEEEALKRLSSDGFFDLEIIRGQKLAANILRECGKLGKTSINTLGRSMILRKVAKDHKEELLRFGKVADSSEFLDVAGDFIVQLKQNEISLEDLDEILEKTPKDSLLFEKLSDMRLITLEYERLLLGKFNDSEDLTAFVTSKVKDSKYIKESIIYFYDFYLFTKREQNYLAELAKNASDFNIAMLCGDGPSFEISRKTVKSLLLDINGLNYKESNVKEPLLSSVASKDGLEIVRCANPYAQAESIASSIKKLVREKGISYQDISVLSTSSQLSTLKRVLESLSVPVFVDEKKSVLQSNYIVSIKALLDIVLNNFESSDVITLLKSLVFDFKDEDIFDFEYYVKKYHIKGDRFKAPLRYGKDDPKFNIFENIRDSISSLIVPFEQEIKEKETVKEKIEVLYTFLLEKLSLAEKLSKESVYLGEDGFVDESEETAQMWDIVISVFDQMAELIGDEKISLDDFDKMLLGCFSDIKIGVLPQAEGKVMLGDITRSMGSKKKAVFIANFNDGLIPSDGKTSNILTDKESSDLKKKGYTLSKSLDTLCDEELFTICRSMTLATDYLGLFYNVTGSDGADLKPSYLLDMIKKSYPNVKETEDIQSRDDIFSYLEGKEMALPRMAIKFREGLSGEDVSDIWKASYDVLLNEPSSKEEIDVLKAGLRYNKNDEPLGIEIAKRLFAGKKDYSFSPTRMDNFASCPFRHFVQYGLKPKEEEDFSIQSAEVGTIHHDAILQFCEMLTNPCRKEGISITDPKSPWMNITDEEIDKIFDDILLGMKDTLFEGLLVSSKEEEYRTARVKSVCKKFAKHIVLLVRDEKIDEMFFETRFARGERFPAIEVNTSSGKAFVEGKIDRIDIMPKGEGSHVRVIDYKSGNTKFRKDLIERGLMLQLMIYLEGVLGDFPKDTPGSVYYIHISEPSVETGISSLACDEISEDVLEKIKKEYKLDGIEVDEDFKLKFKENLTGLCEKLMAGNIKVEPKKIKTYYDSCKYCKFSSICQKDL